MAATNSTASVVQQGFRPGNRQRMGQPVEKPKEGKKTLKRLLGFFLPEVKR